VRVRVTSCSFVSALRAPGAMPAALAGPSGAGEAVRTSPLDDRVRFTTRKVPENPSVKDRAGLPFGVLVQPHLPRSRDGTDAVSDASCSDVPPVVRAEDVARCSECFGYVNGYCGFERDGWICVLCGTFSYWPGPSSHRTRYRRNPRRNDLPEIRGRDLDMEIAVEHIPFDARNPIGTAPAYVVLLDLTAKEDVLEMMRSAVLAAMEAAGEHAVFGVACFDETLTLLEFSSVDTPALKKISVSRKTGAVAVPLEDVMDIENFLVPIKTHKEAISAAVEALASAEERRLEDSLHGTFDDGSGKIKKSVFENADADDSLGRASNASLLRGGPTEQLALKAQRANPNLFDPFSFLRGLYPSPKRKNERGGLLDSPSARASRSGLGGGGAVAALVGAFRRSDLDDEGFGARSVRRRNVRAFDPGDDVRVNARVSRAFGPALEAVLTWLGAEGVEVLASRREGDSKSFPFPFASDPSASAVPNHPSCRVLAFLAGAPDLGDGAISPERRRGGVPETNSTRDGYASAGASADSRAEPESHFYADAGDRAALVGAAVDVFSLAALCGELESCDLATVGLVAERSGGALYHYGSENPNPPLSGDVFRVLRGERRRFPGADAMEGTARREEHRGDAVHCTLRVRTSSEFRVRSGFGCGLIADETYEGLYHVPRCASSDCFAFDFEHRTRRGFGKRNDCPPAAQMAFEFTETESL